MKRATVHVFVVLPKTLATNSAFPSISTINACEGAYLTKSVLWTLRSVCSFLGHTIYLCPTDDLTSKVFPVNTGHKKTIERRQTGRRVDLILEACRRQRTCGRCLIADPCSCRCDCTFVETLVCAQFASVWWIFLNQRVLRRGVAPKQKHTQAPEWEIHGQALFIYLQEKSHQRVTRRGFDFSSIIITKCRAWPRRKPLEPKRKPSLVPGTSPYIHVLSLRVTRDFSLLCLGLCPTPCTCLCARACAWCVCVLSKKMRKNPQHGFPEGRPDQETRSSTETKLNTFPWVTCGWIYFQSVKVQKKFHPPKNEWMNFFFFCQRFVFNAWLRGNLKKSYFQFLYRAFAC